MTVTAATTLYAGTAVPDPMVPVPFRVKWIRNELSDTFTLDLVAESGQPFAFEPGQFNMLYQFGAGEVPISISGDPTDEGTLVHTIRAVGSVTDSMAALSKSDVVGVRGPFGRGWPVEDAKGMDVVIVAGGVGLAPLRPAIYQVLANRADYGKIRIYYGARSPADILFRKELEKWRGRFGLYVDVTVDRADREWLGSVGVVTKLITDGGYDPHATVAMVCGPEVMMRFSVNTLNDHGVPLERIYVSMERNMKCAIGLCGHCQYGPTFVCKDGPVYSYDAARRLFDIREI